jgi:hypothetical protein
VQKPQRATPHPLLLLLLLWWWSLQLWEWQAQSPQGVVRVALPLLLPAQGVTPLPLVPLGLAHQNWPSRLLLLLLLLLLPHQLQAWALLPLAGGH